MTNENLKEVYFGMYCQECLHGKKAEEEPPCCDCLEVPARYGSHIPEKFEQKPKSAAEKKSQA